MTKYPLKLIEWHDAFNGNHGWFKADTMPDAIELMLVSTVGFEVQRIDTHVTLSMSAYERGDDMMLCDLFTIPLGMVVREQTFRRRSLRATIEGTES